MTVESKRLTPEVLEFYEKQYNRYFKEGQIVNNWPWYKTAMYYLFAHIRYQEGEIEAWRATSRIHKAKIKAQEEENKTLTKRVVFDSKCHECNRFREGFVACPEGHDVAPDFFSSWKDKIEKLQAVADAARDFIRHEDMPMHINWGQSIKRLREALAQKEKP